MLSSQLSGNGRDQGVARTRSAWRPMPPSASRSTWLASADSTVLAASAIWASRSASAARVSSSSDAPTYPGAFDSCCSSLACGSPCCPYCFSPCACAPSCSPSMGTAFRIRQAKKKPAPDFTSGTGYWRVTNGREKLARRVALAWLNSGSYELARVSIAYMFDDGIACTANR